MTTEILKVLNIQQRRAATLTGKPVLIIAGPGTGKTKTLVSKIIYIVKEKQQNPSSILALTFTKKAAKEIYSRVEKELGTAIAKKIFIGTFHSFGLSILEKNRKNGEKTPVIDESERVKIIRKLARHEDLGNYFKTFTTKEISLIISNYKNGSSENAKVKKLVKLYDSELAAGKKVDFDDLVLKALALVKDSNNVRESLKKKYKYILIDEFQDTNESQYQIIKEIASGLRIKTGLFVIGDPLQSIYAFRGAKGDVFREFKKDFPKAEQITLDTNYRSGNNIIEASHSLFPLSMKLKSHTKQLGYVNCVSTQNEYTEADLVLSQISQIIGGTNLNEASDSQFGQIDKKATFADFVVIYRTHGLSRILEKKFRENSIPFQIVGGKSVYERPEIELIIDTLKSMQELGQTKAGLVETVRLIVNKFAIEKGLEERENQNRLLDFQGFMSELVRFNNAEGSIGSFLRYIEQLESSDYYDERSDKVTLLTMHAAKGLEFKYVFICGFEEGLIPFTKKTKSEQELEEEKRLLYVAMTRAKNGLLLITAKRRFKQIQEVSSFYRFIKGAGIHNFTDKRSEKIQKWRIKEKARKSQMKMF